MADPSSVSVVVPACNEAEAIAGVVPKLIEPAEGCRFAPRCKHAVVACTQATPPLREAVAGHKVACIFDLVPA